MVTAPHPLCVAQYQQHAGAEGLEFEYTTKLFYMVHIRPKGPVPVLALEWQISNEVPNNLAALKKAAEAVTPEYVEVSTLVVRDDSERSHCSFSRSLIFSPRTFLKKMDLENIYRGICPEPLGKI